MSGPAPVSRAAWVVDHFLALVTVASFVYVWWLLTNFDCSALFVRDAASLVRTFEILPEYLKTAQGNQVVNFRDWSIPLGRRFRSLKLWFVLRYFGREGLIARIREHIRLARLFASWVEESPDFELLAPVPFALVCFRAAPAGVDAFAWMP